jgi:dihydropteroate synthase
VAIRGGRDVTTPFVRVEDAGLVPSGGPARLAVTDLPRAQEVADRVAAARGVWGWVGERLIVTAVPSRLVDAAGRVGGTELAELLRGAVEPAVDAWLGGPPDLPLPAGELATSSRPQVMGILNVTPDSFSDGGSHYDPDDHPGVAVAAGREMLAVGADLVDVGGESTRPGSEPVGADEELRRVVPVIEALAADGAVVSIDTTKARVARAAVEAGAALVNDVSAGALDEDLLPTVASLGVPYVLMHMRGTPRTMQQDPTYDDVVGDVFDFLAHGLERAAAAGIPPGRVAVDPGIGFGKTADHNLVLLRRLREFTSLGRPVVVGTSRKSFLGRFAGSDDPVDRLEGSLATAALAVASGARVVRVHDVAETVRAVATAHAVATA